MTTITGEARDVSSETKLILNKKIIIEHKLLLGFSHSLYCDITRSTIIIFFYTS